MGPRRTRHDLLSSAIRDYQGASSMASRIVGHSGYRQSWTLRTASIQLHHLRMICRLLPYETVGIM